MMKMTHLSSSIMLQLAVVCFCLIVGSFSSPLFKYYPDTKIYTGNGAGSAVKISSDDKYVAVGFSNGTFKVYSTAGYLQCTAYGHYSSIIDIESIDYNGWITLDSSGKAIRWNTYCSSQYTWNFNSTVIDMSLTYSAGYYYVAFNLGNTILEYYATTSSNYTTRTYLAQNNTNFTQIQYGNGYYQLFAATSNSYLQSYYCSNGAYGSQLYIYYPGKKFTKPSSGQMAVINSYYVYKFSSTSSYSYFVYSGSANVVTSSYKDYSVQYITADTTYSNYIYVYSEYGYFQQSLSYMSYTVKAIDASDKYLVAIDSQGYLSINSYQTNDWYPTDFPTWIIWMIIGIVALFVVLIVSIVRRRKKRQALLLTNNYNRFDDQVAPNAPYFAGNQGYNPNPTIVPNQGWNANQNQPYPINQQPQNPYQANQPNTWS